MRAAGEMENAAFKPPPRSAASSDWIPPKRASCDDHAVRVDEGQGLRVGDAGELVVELLSFKQTDYEASCTSGPTFFSSVSTRSLI